MKSKLLFTAILLLVLSAEAVYSQTTTWVTLVSGTNQNLYSVFFTNANNGCVVGEGGTIRRTTNGGTNWSASTSGTNNDLYEVFFLNSTTGYASGVNGTIRKTTNGGVN